MEKVRKKSWDLKVKLAQDSYLRAKSSKLFSKTFYQNLFFLNPKIKDFFQNTDFEHQEKALINGLDFLFGYFDEDENSRDQVNRLAKVHSKKSLNIHPHYYYYWVEALVMTIKERDQKWDQDIEYYMREVISYPISFFISQYFL